MADYAKIFKAYDIRGLVPDEFDADAAERIGAAFARLTGTGAVVIVHDMTTDDLTTLAKILAGLYRPGTGAVYWDQTSLGDVDPEPMRELIAVIAQDHANWPLTVRHNIAMGRTANPGGLAAAAVAHPRLLVPRAPRELAARHPGPDRRVSRRRSCGGRHRW